MDTFIAVENCNLGLGLKSLDILILSKINEFIRNGCECFVTNEWFAKSFGESVSTVKRSLDRLESKGVISRHTHFVSGNGRGNRQRTLTVNDRSKWDVKWDDDADTGKDADVAETNPTPQGNDEVILAGPSNEGGNIDDGGFIDDDGWFTYDEWVGQDELIIDNEIYNSINKNTVASAPEVADAPTNEGRKLEELSNEELAELDSLIKAKNHSSEELKELFRLSNGVSKHSCSAIEAILKGRETERILGRIETVLSERGLTLDEGIEFSHYLSDTPIEECGEGVLELFGRYSESMSMSTEELLSFCREDELASYKTWSTCAPKDDDGPKAGRFTKLYPTFEGYLKALLNDRESVIKDLAAEYSWIKQFIGLNADKTFPIHLFAPRGLAAEAL